MNIDNNKTQLCSWLKDHIASNNKKALLIYIKDDSIYSVLNYYICKSSGIAVHAVIDSKPESLSQEFCIRNCIAHSIFRSDTKYDSLIINVNHPGMEKISYIENLNVLVELELTAFIAYVAETTNSLYCGNLSRNDYLFIRNYPKVNAYDLLPFANFSDTELLEIITYYNLNNKLYAQSIANNTPAINLNIEWLYKANEQTKFNSSNFGIVESDKDPTKYEKWYSYTSMQKTLIARIHQQEKLTRYKKCNAKIFERTS